MDEIHVTQITPIELEYLIRKVLINVLNTYVNNTSVIKEEKLRDKILTRKETAASLRISLPTLDKWTREGKLKGYRISNRVRYKETEVKEALKKMKVVDIE